MKAFIEINAKAGEIDLILGKLRKMEGVQSVTAVTGHCDNIAIVIAEKMEEITNILLDEIHKIKGVIKTETLFCISPEK